MLHGSGASHSFVSYSIARKLGGKVRWHVERPNGEKMRTGRFCRAPVRIGGWSSLVTMWELDLKEYDVILGYDFVRKFNPTPDWSTASVKIRDARGRMHTLRAVGRTLHKDLSWQLNTISRKQTVRALKKKGTQAFLSWVRPSSEDVGEEEVVRAPSVHPNPRVHGLLDEFSEVFPKELLKQLPPERTIQHEIDTGDAHPVNVNVHPMSHAKLAEQAKQVTELIKKGLIRGSTSPWGFPVIFVQKPRRGVEDVHRSSCTEQPHKAEWLRNAADPGATESCGPFEIPVEARPCLGVLANAYG